MRDIVSMAVGLLFLRSTVDQVMQGGGPEP